MTVYLSEGWLSGRLVARWEPLGGDHTLQLWAAQRGLHRQALPPGAQMRVEPHLLSQQLLLGYFAS